MHELLQYVEDIENNVEQTKISVAIMPPVNCCEPVTDEDSGDEDIMNIGNLPGLQLRVGAELFQSC